MLPVLGAEEKGMVLSSSVAAAALLGCVAAVTRAAAGGWVKAVARMRLRQ